MTFGSANYLYFRAFKEGYKGLPPGKYKFGNLFSSTNRMRLMFRKSHVLTNMHINRYASQISCPGWMCLNLPSGDMGILIEFNFQIDDYVK